MTIQHRTFDEMSFTIARDNTRTTQALAIERFELLLVELRKLYKRNIEARNVRATHVELDHALTHDARLIAYVTLAYDSDDDVMQLATTYKALRRDAIRCLL